MSVPPQGEGEPPYEPFQPYPSYPQYGGGPSGPPPYGPPSYGAPTNGLAIASMVVSLVALVGGMLCCVLPGLLGLVGAVMGHVARRQIRASGESGNGFALAGIVIGWIVLALTLVVVVLVVTWLSASFSDLTPGDPGISI